MVGSLPVWGEWIEIGTVHCLYMDAPRLSPCGESGLKSLYHACNRMWIVSLPVWGEWIEIAIPSKGGKSDEVSPRVGRVD